MRTFEFSEGALNKFWNITLQGNKFTVNFGRIGTAGQTQIKDFPTDEQARKEHDKLVAEKVKKGYKETTPAAANPAPPAAPGPAAAPAKKAPEPVPAPPPAPKPAPAPAPAAASALRTFAFSDASSHKFWNIELKGTSFTVTYGRQGTGGQTQLKTFGTEDAARKEHDKLVAEKVKKGYKETTPTKPAAPTSLKESLEAALVEHPDDLASHMAYADYLTDHDDPRGDFIRVQLAMEDEKLKPAERKKLEAQEKKLLKAHEEEWLGELGDKMEAEVEYSFRRGWLHSLKIHDQNVASMRALAKAPAARLVQVLHLGEEEYEDEGEYEAGPDIPEDAEDSPALYPLINSPVLGNVKTLIVGDLMDSAEEADGYFNCHTNGRAVAGMVKTMPKLEELRLYAHNVDANQLFSLRTMPNLRVLELYHSHSYPLGRLAKNTSLKNLTTLRFHPHGAEDGEPYIKLAGIRELVRSAELPALTYLQLRMTDAGDRGVKEIIDSGILKRLKVLDLQCGVITDAGVDMLAKCPDVRNLERIDLSHNKITPAAVARLEATGVKVTAGHQRRPDDSDEEYLYMGDIE